MNPAAGRGIKLAVVLLVAAVFQSVFADAWSIGGAHPDFLLTAALVGALFCNGSGGAALGFFGGLLYASLSAPPHAGFGSLIVSRTLVVFAVGWLEERIFRDSVLVALLVVGLGTILAEGLFFIFAPQAHVLQWARSMGLTTLYDLLLAAPLYYLIRLLLGRHRGKERL